MRHEAEACRVAESYLREVAASSPVDELAKLNDLRRNGAITPAEYGRLKAKLIGTGNAVQAPVA